LSDCAFKLSRRIGGIEWPLHFLDFRVRRLPAFEYFTDFSRESTLDDFEIRLFIAPELESKLA